MKAVILAGGKGSRLRPLTCNKPKPMVPLLGVPCMEYTIDLLRAGGIQDIAVTLQYMPESIKGYFGDGAEFGVNMEYFEETSPLGTAGSVKNAAMFLDETFVVISGDALTDFDLLEAVRSHREKGAQATIILTRVDTPLEYGVAITEPDGRILRFLEKPSWGEVFSDTVNTGIYIFEPQVLDFIPDDQEFDFSKDLFPFLMKNGYDLHGHVAVGYWSDIGNLAQYRQTQFDMMDGKVQVSVRGTRVAPRVWVGQGTQIAPDATLEGPCYLGRDTVVESGVHIGPYTVLGEGNVIKPNASLKRTIVWNRNYFGEGVELRGNTVCSQTTLEAHAACFEGSVIGDSCVLGEKSVLKPQVKLWPAKRVQEGTMVHASLIWGEKLEKNLFGMHGVQGICNVDLTPDFAGRLAAAYGAALPQGACLAITCDGDPFACLIKRAFTTGLHSAGVNTLDLPTGTTPMLRYAVKRWEVQGGVHVRRRGQAGDDRLLIEFVDARGLNIDKGLERKIENAYWQEDFRRASRNGIGRNEVCPQLDDAYVIDLLRLVDNDSVKRVRFRLAVQSDGGPWAAVLPTLLDRLGVKAQWVDAGVAAKGELQSVVTGGGFHLGVHLDENGEKIALVTELGHVIEGDTMLALQMLVHLMTGGTTFAVPVTAPTILERLAQQFGGEVVRTKANTRSLMTPMQEEKFPPLHDALHTLVKVLSALAESGLSLSKLLDSIPHFHILRRDVYCPWEEKGRVMRMLIEETKGETVELLDGIKVFAENGWTLILPHSDEPSFQVFAQGATKQEAEALAGVFEEKIRVYQNGTTKGR
jgi:mannose-1-phosphate guanylyltransferase / phosphomannomutase